MKESLVELKNKIKSMSNEELIKIISHGALQYNDSITETVSFVFWVCYMVEQDMLSTMKDAWRLAKLAYPEYSNNDQIIDIIKKEHGVKLYKVDPEEKDYSEKNIYFNDLIQIKESMTGETNSTKFFRKIKKIRNDLSHGRINRLEYESESLFIRLTKEKLLIDYFNLITEKMLKNSPIWKKLSPEQRISVEEKFNKTMK